MYSFLALRSGSYACAVQATRSEGRHGRPHHPPDCVHQGLVKIPRIFLAHVLDTSALRVDDAFYQPRSGIPRRRRMYARIADEELSRPKPVLSCFAARRRDKLFPILLVKNHSRPMALRGAPQADTSAMCTKE